MKIDVQNIINNPFHTDLRQLKASSDKEEKELIALRSAAMEQVSRFFSSRPGFSKMASKADQALFAKPKAAPDMMVDAVDFNRTMGLEGTEQAIRATDVLKNEMTGYDTQRTAFVEFKQTITGDPKPKDITMLSVSAKGKPKEFEAIQSEISKKGVFRPGTGKFSLSKDDAVNLLLSKPLRGQFVELMRAALQKYENYALLNVLDADKVGKAKTELLFAPNPLAQAKKQGLLKKNVFMKNFSIRIKDETDRKENRYRFSIAPTPELEKTFKKTDIMPKLQQLHKEAGTTISKEFEKFVKDYVKEQAMRPAGSVSADSVRKMHGFLLAFLEEFKAGGLTPFVIKSRVKNPPKPQTITQRVRVMATAASRTRRQVTPQRFISGVQIAKLVQKRLLQTMQKGGEASPPELTERSGRFRNSVQVLANYKKNVIAFKYNPLYDSLKKYGYMPDQQVATATREVVQALFARAFNIVKA
tara:strand:- start:805 stop:2220 length:1416 start_codon:yes stop_codon:yes gene_type:complete